MIPNAPKWPAVFIFGGAWNLVIESALTPAAVCFFVAWLCWKYGDGFNRWERQLWRGGSDDA